MRLFILLIFLLTSCHAFATNLNCYIIGENKIELRTSPPGGVLVEKCPIDNIGSRVTDIDEIAYQKLNTTSCLDKDDCFKKSEKLCIDDRGDSVGRPVVGPDFTEVYCTKPVYSQSKRSAKESEKLAKKTEIENELLAKKAARKSIKNAKANIDKMTLNELKALVLDIITVLQH